MHVAQTKDTMSDLYLDAVRLRQRVFVAEQGVPEEMEIDEYEAHCIHFVHEPCSCRNLSLASARKWRYEITTNGR